MTETFHDLTGLLDGLASARFDRPPALISNAHITGLGVARALSRHGVPTIALDRTDGGVAYPSKAVDFAGAVTYPLDDQSAFAEDVEQVVDAVGSEVVVFGCMDEWVHAYAEADPDGVVLPFADAATVDAVLNKSSLYHMAEALGVPYPATYRIGEYDPEEVLELLEFPFVVKPEHKREFEEAIGTNVVEVDGPDAFHDIIDRAASNDVAVMAQERVQIRQGDDRSFVSYTPPRSDGAIDGVMGLVGNPAVRYPLAFGTSCVVEQVVDPVIEGHALSVLDEAGYHGISEAEFVYDRTRGEHVLLDINTRPWKWIAMPVAAGLNLPYAAYGDALGLERPEYTLNRPGMRWIYLRDYLALLAEGSDPGVIGRDEWSALVDGSFEGAAVELTTGVYRPSDPGPAAKLIADEFSDTAYYCAC